MSTGPALQSLHIDYHAIERAALPAISKIEFTALRRLHSNEVRALEVEVSEALEGAQLLTKAPPLLIRLEGGQEAIIALGTRHDPERGASRISILAVLGEGCNILETHHHDVAGPTREFSQTNLFNSLYGDLSTTDRYRRLTDAYEDSFQRIQNLESSRAQEEKFGFKDLNPEQEVSEVKKRLTLLAQSAGSTPEVLIEEASLLAARLGSSIKWDRESPHFSLLESLRNLVELGLSLGPLTPRVSEKIQKSCTEALQASNPESLSTFEVSHRLREHSLEFHALQTIEALQNIYFRSEAAIRFKSDQTKLSEDFHALKQDLRLSELAEILGDNEMGIIPGLSKKSLSAFLKCISKALRQQDLKLLDPARDFILKSLSESAPSSHRGAIFQSPDLAIQLFHGSEVPLWVFERFAELNALTAKTDPKVTIFKGTEHIWSAEELQLLFRQHNGALFTATQAEGITPRFFYLLLPNGTPFGEEKKAILQDRGILPPAVDHYTYLVVGEQEFSKKIALQGTDLYQVITQAARGFAHYHGSDHLLARVREGNLALRSHERVGWNVIADYQDQNSTYSYGIMQCSTWPSAET